VLAQAQATAQNRGLAALQGEVVGLKAQLSGALAAQERLGAQLAGQAEKLLVRSRRAWGLPAAARP
jgi:hypothetical protein